MHFSEGLQTDSLTLAQANTPAAFQDTKAKKTLGCLSVGHEIVEKSKTRKK